ncbi:hypothetical protein CSUI_002575 [Cystoisospora suis]|uniref:Uncharacterized protein n=1 Tax=Cystoisospora suis TaxID=483139 RepID=A0A2C6KTG9_9APIC|nr:hypothetical protein CSUI_002575 [Cystoisospora suis]
MSLSLSLSIHMCMYICRYIDGWIDRQIGDRERSVSEKLVREKRKLRENERGVLS